jgi:succinate dehydrogenase flavin-adding protein (antitoxin of CptAB toxin-antitoxin module)
MSKSLLIKKLNFKARRGMKETSEILDKLFNSIDKFTDNELNQLEWLLNLDDQSLFDLFFKEKDKFDEEFYDLKKYLK